MKESKQAQELAQTIDELKTIYGFTYSALSVQLKYEKDKDILAEVVGKALQWDIFRAKCAKGAKVASGNLTRKERIDRAKKASQAKTIKAEKEKARKEMNRIKRGKTRTKTEHSA